MQTDEIPENKLTAIVTGITFIPIITFLFSLPISGILLYFWSVPSKIEWLIVYLIVSAHGIKNSLTEYKIVYNLWKSNRDNSIWTDYLGRKSKEADHIRFLGLLYGVILWIFGITFFNYFDIGFLSDYLFLTIVHMSVLNDYIPHCLVIIVLLFSIRWRFAFYFIRGKRSRKNGKYDQAISDFSKALKMFPQDSKIYSNRGVVWLDKGEYDQAIADFNKALEFHPQLADVYYNRGFAWSNKGDYDKAIADCRKTIDINPGDDRAYKRIAWLLATCLDDKVRNGELALEWAKKALELNPYNPLSIDALAAAYAETGDFNKAIEIQKRALTLIEKSYQKEYIERLESYKAQKPWREK